MRINYENNEKIIKINDLDLKILEVLYENSKTSIKEISKLTRVSRDIVNYRIKKLENLRIIKKFTIAPNYKILGFMAFHIFLEIDETHDSKEFLKYLKENKNTISIIEYNDFWEIEWMLITKDIEEFDKIINYLEEKFSNLITEKTSILEINRYRATNIKNFFTDFSEDEKNKDNLKIDSIDMDILKELNNNSRLSTYEIGDKIGLSSGIVLNRSKKMKKNNIIRRYSITPDLGKIGYNWNTLCISTKSFTVENEKRFKKFIEKQNGIITSSKCFGEYNIILYIITKSQKELHDFLKNLKILFPGLMKSYLSLNAYKEHYFNPLPERLIEEFANK